MDWSFWKGKNIFIKTKNSGVYSGKCISIDYSDNEKTLIFLTLIDKFGNRVTIINSEIIKIVEEKFKQKGEFDGR